MLCINNFKHGFFTKSSSEKYLPFISNHFNKNYEDCLLNQVHSNKIVYGSSTHQIGNRIEADGIVCDKFNQNLWIYTADCMPILFADKRKRVVAALHCGRKGLEKKIIKNLVKIFDDLGCCRNDLLVAIGPSISKKKYLIDKKTLKEFYKKTKSEKLKISVKKSNLFSYFRNLDIFKEQDLFQLDLRKYAQLQLLDERIPNTNIEISDLCTFKSNNKLYSWRKNKTALRQWNFIST